MTKEMLQPVGLLLSGGFLPYFTTADPEFQIDLIIRKKMIPMMIR